MDVEATVSKLPIRQLILSGWLLGGGNVSKLPIRQLINNVYNK